MELSERKQAILEAVINAYIESGEPVGSKALCVLLGTTLSSATLRNELSELCEMGYLSQPHTSAGRVPTNEAYRLYIRAAGSAGEPPRRVRDEIDDMLFEASRDPVHFSDLAARMLAEFTGLPAVLATVEDAGDYVRRVELLPMGRRAVLLLLVSADNVAKSRFCRVEGDVTPELVRAFNDAVSRDLIGVPFCALPAEPPAGVYPGILRRLLCSAYEMANEAAHANIAFGGDASGLTERRDELLRFLAEMDEDVGVVFGDTTGIDAFKPVNLVVARYSTGSSAIGRVGVIGPARMAYRQMLPGLRYFAGRLGELFEQTVLDMEEQHE